MFDYKFYDLFCDFIAILTNQKTMVQLTFL